jgi:cytochrome c oxidase subunit 4
MQIRTIQKIYKMTRQPLPLKYKVKEYDFIDIYRQTQAPLNPITSLPFSILRNVAVTLLILTVITVATAQLKLGALAAPIAFLIAFIKAMLVMMYFMGLKYDEKLNRMIFATGFIFLALLFAFSAIDIWTRIAQQSPL